MYRSHQSATFILISRLSSKVFRAHFQFFYQAFYLHMQIVRPKIWTPACTAQYSSYLVSHLPLVQADLVSQYLSIFSLLAFVFSNVLMLPPYTLKPCP